MANQNRPFTDRLESSESERLTRLRDQLDARQSEANDLTNRMDLAITDFSVTGEPRSGTDGRRGKRMKAALVSSFYRAAEQGDATAIHAFLLAGFDPNEKRAKSQDTVLHIAATRNARDVARVLIESRKCDYLLRDGQGRLASEKAYLFGNNPALARLLGIKERDQAEASGIRLTRKPAAPE